MRWVVTLVALAAAACGADGGAARAFEVATVVDRSGTAAVEDVRSGAMPWTARDDAELSFGHTRDAIWVRVRVAAADADRVLLVASSQLDEVDAYVAGRVVRTGDTRPASARELHHHQFAFRLPAGVTEAYVRVRTSGSAAIPVRVMPADGFWRDAARDNLGWGFYLAFLIAIAGYNAFLYVALRARAYLYYVAYLTAFVLFQASLAGHAALYLWPGATTWTSLAPSTFVALAVGASILFARDLVDVKETAPRLFRPMGWLAGGFAAAVLWLWVDFAHALRPVTAACALAVLALAVPIGAAWRQGHPMARWFVYAYAAMVPGTVIAGLRYAGAVDDTLLTRHALHVSTMAEALLLSLALAHRVTLLTRERTEAQARALAAQEAERRRIAADLHDDVGQRMLALSMRLGRAARTDDAAATGERPAVLAELAAESRAVIGDLRRIAHDLHPDAVTRLGLAGAIEAAAHDTLEPAGVEVRCQVDAIDGALASTAAVHVYRIAQEACANVARHAEARAVHVVLARQGARLVLQIDDDGRGLDGERAGGAGHGLRGMRERAAMLGGTLTVGRSERGGVRVRAEVPIEARTA